VAAHSEGGGVEVNSGNAIMSKSLRERTAVAHSEAGVEVAACSGARARRQRALGPGSRTTGGGGGGGVTVSRATAERESVRSKFC
jgi:hypothetical protein